jgi:phage shock protein E
MITFFKNLFTRKVDLVKLVRQGAVVVDVRTKQEYGKGNLEGSTNIPLDTIERETERLKKLNRPIVTVCRSGHRSKLAKSVLSSAGVEVYNGGNWVNLQNLLQLHP